MGPKTLPALFVSHGAPLEALQSEGAFARDLRRFVEALSPPHAIVIVSAHWETPGEVRVTASDKPPTIYDFGGFPEELYRIGYPCPGEPTLAAEVVALLKAAGIRAAADPRRGLDHGAWVPLLLAFPRAHVPVVQVSLPRRAFPQGLAAQGAALSALRDRGVLLIGSGGAVHNLARADLREGDAEAEDWARTFDDWLARRLAARDFAAILDYRTRGPQARLAAPTPEHFDPLLLILGAARPGERVTTVHEGFRYGSLSMRSFAIS
jgi:4,5-DOPA dioxygenase extradiol